MLKDLCFEVIQTCPNKCKFCSSKSSKEKKTIITLEQFKKTINHFINQGGIEEISISGGEPFLHPELFDMIKFSKDNGTNWVDNGTNRVYMFTGLDQNATYNYKVRCTNGSRTKKCYINS